MSLYDDMFDLDDYFKVLVKKNTKGTTGHANAKVMKEAWARISKSHADMERKEMVYAPVMESIATILRVFEVNRGYDDSN
jgi:hypothetical protein